MTISRLHVTVFLALAVGGWLGLLIASGTPVTWDHLTPFGTVVGFLVLASFAFEHLLWRQAWLHGWFVKRPNLRGTWRVEVQSDWVNPKTGEGIPPVVGYMGVEQTFSKLQMHLMTAESESVLVANEVSPSPSATGYRIAGVYTNQPQVQLRGDRSEMHYGALVLYTHGRPARPESLTGEYWTDRSTAGRMTLTNRVVEVVTLFEDAEKHFNSI